jgi:hypothetical protein
LPLYRGTILAVRQDWGGAEVMALELRKFARLPTPAGPMNFSRWGGKALYPLLFVALYFYYNMYSNSY